MTTVLSFAYYKQGKTQARALLQFLIPAAQTNYDRNDKPPYDCQNAKEKERQRERERKV